MQYFEILSAKTITYSHFLGILNKIPFSFGYALPFLDFCGTKIFVAFCVNTSFQFLFFSNRCCPKLAFVHILYKLCFVPQVMIVDEFTLNFKGTICIVCCNCKLNYLAFFS